MTTTETKSAIRKLGFVVTYEDGEFRIALPLRLYNGDIEFQERQACYTNDAGDALEMAQAWAKQITDYKEAFDA